MVSLRVGETEYPIKTTFGTLCDLENHFGEGVNAILARFASTDTMRLTDVRAFLAITLRDADGKKFEPERAHDLADAAGVEACCEAVGEALRTVFAGMGMKKGADNAG